MANILRNLNINGAQYNVGYSQNDLTNELKAKYDASEQNAINASAVTITESEGTGDILKKYVFSQNGAEIGTINLAKDLVVSGGQVVEKEGVKYLQLTIANQENPVEIAVSDLVDVYKGSAYIEIASDNTISVKFADLATALAAEGNAVGNAIKANADAAAAAKDAADEAQLHSEGVRTDLGESGAAAGTGSAFARIKQLESDVAALTGGESSIATQISEAIEAYDTETVQPIAADVNTIKGDYLKTADKTELQKNIDAKVAQTDYDTKMSALDKSIGDNTTAIGNNAEAIATMGEKLSGVSANAKNVTTSYEASTETLTITIA